MVASVWAEIIPYGSKCFKLAKERSRRYPAQTITDADYADDKALLAKILAQA